MSNPFRGVRIEFHILQSFPVTCLNRDDVGSPKSCIVGGVMRARVSSQCWKRQVRLTMHDFGVKLAHRSKLVAAQMAAACQKLGATEEAAQACGEAMAAPLSKDTLFFFTDTEVQACATYTQSLNFNAKAIKGTEITKILKKSLKLATDGLDIALFGRMVAQAPELNIKAAASFSHAISTHAVVTDLDFFTALDDLNSEKPTAHLDNLEFNSATYYRYVSLDLGQLYDSLGGENLGQSVDAFTKALFIAIPAARQNTLSGACPWDYAKVLIRRGQRVQLSFDRPVKSRDGFLEPSINALKSELAAKEKVFGSLFGKIAEFTIDTHNVDSPSIDDLIESLNQQIEAING